MRSGVQFNDEAILLGSEPPGRVSMRANGGARRLAGETNVVRRQVSALHIRKAKQIIEDEAWLVSRSGRQVPGVCSTVQCAPPSKVR
jgi:hypothetical protein